MIKKKKYLSIFILKAERYICIPALQAGRLGISCIEYSWSGERGTGCDTDSAKGAGG